MSIEVIRPDEKFARFADLWHPRIVARLNDHLVKLARVAGEFAWHQHDDEDELFLVIEGRLHIDLRDRTLDLGPGELCVIPRGTEHRPRAETETKILLLEPLSTVNTGDADDPRKRDRLEWI